jgi:hypothetical protein
VRIAAILELVGLIIYLLNPAARITDNHDALLICSRQR